MAQQRGEMQIQTGAGIQKQSRIIRVVANSPTVFGRTKGVSIKSQRVVQARATRIQRVAVSSISIATERV